MLKMNTNLYNNDGTLSTQAQSLLSPKPADMSMSEWKKLLNEFRSQLSAEDVREFEKLRRNAKALHYHKIRSADENYLLKNRTRSNVYYQSNKEERKACNRAYRNANKEEAKAYGEVYRKTNKEKKKEYDRVYRELNKERLKAHRETNKEKTRAYRRKYEKNCRKEPIYNFFHTIRTQTQRVVKQVGLGKKPTNTFKWVGCSPEQLKAHIESLFQEGMTWDNYGKYGWHVDHIRPVSSFKPEEWEQINHYTNLQPLWWQDNLSKSDNY